MTTFITRNTKNGNEYIYDLKEVEKLFMCDTFNDSHILKKDYDDYLDNLANEIGEDEDENEIREYYINYWSAIGRDIHESEIEYLKEMIEYETWTSPRGVEPVFRVIEIKEA